MAEETKYAMSHSLSLDKPAPVTPDDPLCECGGHKHEHDRGQFANMNASRKCESFRPAKTQPTAAPAPDATTH